MMTAEHLDIWHRLERTDPDQVKAFQRPGGFKGTAIKPMYCLRKMTEVFGPCGKGWGMHQPTFETVHVGEEVAVYCTVGLWWGTEEDCHAVVGVGGDMVVKRTRNGLMVDDEAFKKAYTDAITNAMKHLGMSADVHMGLFDDSKYVAELRRESHAEPPQETTKPRAAAPRREPEFSTSTHNIGDATKIPTPDEALVEITGPPWPLFDVNGTTKRMCKTAEEWCKSFDNMLDGVTPRTLPVLAGVNRDVKIAIEKAHKDDDDIRIMLADLRDRVGQIQANFKAKGKAA